MLETEDSQPHAHLPSLLLDSVRTVSEQQGSSRQTQSSSLSTHKFRKSPQSILPLSRKVMRRARACGLALVMENSTSGEQT